MSTLIDSLYSSIADHEAGGSAFRPEVFEERYRGILGLFAGLDTDERLAAADAALTRAIGASHLTSSGLRYLASHLLAIDFEYQANRGRAHRLSYDACAAQRRQKMNDGEFIRLHLVPVLFEPKSLGDHHRIRWILLEHMASLANQDPGDVWPDFLPIKQVERSAASECLFQLMRRRLLSPDTPLHLRPNTLEQNLRNAGFFKRMGMGSSIHQAMLVRLGYIEVERWRDRLDKGISLAREQLRGRASEPAAGRSAAGGGIYALWSILSVLLLAGVLVAWTLIHSGMAARMQEQTEVLKSRLHMVLEDDLQ